MFSKISWTNYWMFIFLTLVVYYATVVLLYYLNEIKQIFSGKWGLLLKLNATRKYAVTNASEPQLNTMHNGSYASNSETVWQASANDCMNDIKKSLQYAANNNLVKQEIIYILQKTLNKYSMIESASFKSFITNYILVECKNYCSIHLDEGDLTGVWAS